MNKFVKSEIKNCFFTAIIGSIDQISREMEMKEKQKKKKEELIIYVKSKEFEKAMKIIGTKFEAEKYGLNLSIEDDPGMKKREKIKKTLKKLIVDPYHKEVETFLKNLENVKGHCHAEIVEFEKEIPMKKYIKAMNAKLKENFGQFFGLVMKAIGQKYGAKAEKKKMMIYTLENAKIFLEELAKLTTQKFGPNCEKRKGTCSLNPQNNFFCVFLLGKFGYLMSDSGGFSDVLMRSNLVASELSHDFIKSKILEVYVMK